MAPKIISLSSLDENEERVLGQVLDAIRGMKYGLLQITVHNSRVVQIDRTEKTRLEDGKENGKSRE